MTWRNFSPLTKRLHVAMDQQIHPVLYWRPVTSSRRMDTYTKLDGLQRQKNLCVAPKIKHCATIIFLGNASRLHQTCHYGFKHCLEMPRKRQTYSHIGLMVTSNAAFVGSQVRFPADGRNISTWGLDILTIPSALRVNLQGDSLQKKMSCELLQCINVYINHPDKQSGE